MTKDTKPLTGEDLLTHLEYQYQQLVSEVETVLATRLLVDIRECVRTQLEDIELYEHNEAELEGLQTFLQSLQEGKFTSPLEVIGLVRAYLERFPDSPLHRQSPDLRRFLYGVQGFENKVIKLTSRNRREGKKPRWVANEDIFELHSAYKDRITNLGNQAASKIEELLEEILSSSQVKRGVLDSDHECQLLSVHSTCLIMKRFFRKLPAQTRRPLGDLDKSVANYLKRQGKLFTTSEVSTVAKSGPIMNFVRESDLPELLEQMFLVKLPVADHSRD